MAPETVLICALWACIVSSTRIGAAAELIICERPSNAVSCRNFTDLMVCPLVITSTCTTPYWVCTAAPA